MPTRRRTRIAVWACSSTAWNTPPTWPKPAASLRTTLPVLMAHIKSVYREIEKPTDSPLKSVLRGGGKPTGFGSSGYAGFARSLTAAVRQSSKNCDRSGRSGDQREWDRADLLGLWKTLANDADPATRAAGLCGLVTVPGIEAAQAAAELLAIVGNWPPIDDGRIDLACDLAYLALTRLADTQAEQEFVERLLQQAERRSDAKSLVRYAMVLQRAIDRTSRERAQDWCQRPGRCWTMRPRHRPIRSSRCDRPAFAVRSRKA